jgi:hypothetical protein
MSTPGGPPYQAACPVFTDVRGYILAIAREIAEIDINQCQAKFRPSEYHL